MNRASLSPAVVNKMRRLAWQIRQPTILDRKVLPTPGFPMNTRLAPLCGNSRSSSRGMRFLFYIRVL
jgi:hypothetical protein